MTEKTIFIRKIAGGRFPKKRRLGPQNGSGSLGPEKLLKIVNCAIIKETENAERNNGGVQVDLAGGHQYPPGSRCDSEVRVLHHYDGHSVCKYNSCYLLALECTFPCSCV